MTDEGEEKFQSSNECWICEKLIDDENGKVRDPCHITEKNGGAAHWSYKVNLKLTKKVFVIIFGLKEFDSHLIMNETDKFDVNARVIASRLENTWLLW